MLGNWLKTSLLMALLFGGAMNLFAYWFSDTMVLKMYNAQEVDEASAPQFYSMVRDLAQRGGLPMPRVYLIDEAQPNAFATGRNPDHAAVAATSGILRILGEDVGQRLADGLRHQLDVVLDGAALIAGVTLQASHQQPGRHCMIDVERQHLEVA